MLAGDYEEGKKKCGKNKQQRLVEFPAACIGEPVLEGVEQSFAARGQSGRAHCFRTAFCGVWRHTLFLKPHRHTGTLKIAINYNPYPLSRQLKELAGKPAKRRA